MKKLFGIDRIAAMAAEAAEGNARMLHESLASTAGSPIEALFETALRQYLFGPLSTIGLPGGIADGLLPPPPSEAPFLAICRQVKLDGEWPVDFVLQYTDGSFRSLIVVECDGHDFHERTKEQAARDRSRDRWVQSQGHTIFRFTGSEIYRDPTGCAWQAYLAVLKVHTAERAQ